MPKAPKSYLNRRRPSLLDAIRLEGGTFEKATASLTKKGYFTPPPRPWELGFKNRGHDHGDFAVLDKFGDLVAEAPNRETAELIIEAVNGLRTTNPSV